jgi:hypothetical protein
MLKSLGPGRMLLRTFKNYGLFTGYVNWSCGYVTNKL